LIIFRGCVEEGARRGYAARLHIVDEERRCSQIAEDASVKISRGLLIELVRHVHNLEELIAELQG
jgi:hypothetical protein